MSRILGVGMDLVGVERFAARLESPAFRRRVFTAEEIAAAERSAAPVRVYAMKFAAKEAVMKCLGAGLRQGVWFSQIEVLDELSPAPRLTFSGRAREVSERHGAACWKLVVSDAGRRMHALALRLAPCQATGTAGP